MFFLVECYCCRRIYASVVCIYRTYKICEEVKKYMLTLAGPVMPVSGRPLGVKERI
jgi:hypothetical protein